MGGFLFGIFVVFVVIILGQTIFYLLEGIFMGIAYLISRLFKGWD